MIGLPDIDSELIARAKKKDEEAIAISFIKSTSVVIQLSFNV